jgi:DNA-binding FadR family transcriptional regulator
VGVTVDRFEPVERRTVADEVREAIAARIRDGELMPGAVLPTERELCQQFGVARTSLREAIQGLLGLGLLQRRGKHCWVAELLPDVQLDGSDKRKQRVRELFEVRQVVEIPIARLAATRASDEDREELRELADQFSPSMPLPEFRRLDRAFHLAVARACGNATLAELYGKVMESLFASRELDDLLSSRSNRKAVQEVIRSSAWAHERIAKAIGEADDGAAEQAAVRHLSEVENQMISKMV